MNPMLAFFILITNGFGNLIYLLNSVHFLIEVLVGLKILDILLTHTNLKTWVAKAIWGVKYGVAKFFKAWDALDRLIVRTLYKREI